MVLTLRAVLPRPVGSLFAALLLGTLLVPVECHRGAGPHSIFQAAPAAVAAAQDHGAPNAEVPDDLHGRAWTRAGVVHASPGADTASSPLVADPAGDHRSTR